MSNIKFCQNCRNKNNKDLFFSGYYDWLDDDCYTCPMKDCGHELIDINLSKEDYKILTSISNDVDFIESMIRLHDSDPIEYQLKLSQFKANLSQTKAVEENSVPKCPTCNSTKLSKISSLSKASSVVMFGLLSQKVKKTWHCDNCGYEW